jgi:hypothetical protein
MKITLTPSQAATLKRAPNEWVDLPDSTVTQALRLHGLIEIRSAPGERTIHRGYQWKITLTGFQLDGRKFQPKPEPEMADIHKAELAAIHRAAVDGKISA